MANQNQYKPNYINLVTSMVITLCVIGILNGAGIILPFYSWFSIGILIGLFNPLGSEKIVYIKHNNDKFSS